MVREAGNPLTRLQAMGQSVWLDDIRRDMLDDGTMVSLIDADGVSGLTSNPAIFERAIKTGIYAEAISGCRRAGLSPKAIYENIALKDIIGAAELLLPVYEKSGHVDGYVSLEVSPHLADDTDGTCKAARRLWSLVGRPNLMIKVPATRAGIDAIAILIGEGININATLLFSRDVYREVASAWMSGLEYFHGHGGDPGKVASVASFFVSRIDTAVDKLIHAAMTSAGSHEARKMASLAGKVAIASARLAYQDYLEIQQGERCQALQRAGEQPQRLLWGSTGTKNPQYRDVLYVEELIGPQTVTTVPLPTLEAFRDHGNPRASLIEAPDEAAFVLESLSKHGISLEAVTNQLTREGIALFCQANDEIISALASSGLRREEAR